MGTSLGLLAGYRGGWVDALIMRMVDLSLAFPSILLALIFAVTWCLASGSWSRSWDSSLWARYARLVRGEVLTWKQRDFVALARMAGCSSLRIIARHLLPNVANSVVVLFHACKWVGPSSSKPHSASWERGFRRRRRPGVEWWRRVVNTWKRSGGYPCFPVPPSCSWCCRLICSVTGCGIF